MEPLAVTGYGLTTALGLGADETWRALLRGESGIRPLRSIDVTASSVKDGGEAPPLPDEPRDRRERAAAHLLRACREALALAGLGDRVPDPERSALVLGSSLAAHASSPAFWDAWLARGPEGADVSELRSYDVEPGIDALACALDVRGDTLLVSTACAAGASAVAAASDAIRVGRADLAVVAGWDALEVFTFAGFASLRALSPGPVRPFGAERAGMKLGDGFAALVLEREETARRAGRRMLARLLGYGESSDAHHLTQPDPSGRGAVLAMRRALACAGIGPDAVDHVNAHATSTPANDAAEARALREVFGARVARIPVSASKAAVGHTLGGAGAVEAVLSLLVLRDQRLPATLGVGPIEAGLGSLDLIPEARPARVRVVMSNNFGFGGCDASLVFGEGP